VKYLCKFPHSTPKKPHFTPYPLQNVKKTSILTKIMNILICDDIKEDADKLAALIAESGFEAQTAVFTDSRQALDYFHSGANIDACFLDIIMPKMNGIKLAERLRENNFASQSYRVQAFDYLHLFMQRLVMENFGHFCFHQ